MLENQSPPAQTVIDLGTPGGAVAQDMSLDSTGEYLYVLAGNQVNKLSSVPSKRISLSSLFSLY